MFLMGLWLVLTKVSARASAWLFPQIKGSVLLDAPTRSRYNVPSLPEVKQAIPSGT